MTEPRGGLPYALARDLLFRLDPETAHGVVFRLLEAAGPAARAFARAAFSPPDPSLAVEVAGLRFTGPVGLAAGLDKDGRLARLWPELGFGSVELGTVTALPQPGNPRPRLFRLPGSRALVNRMGFNNLGSEALARRLGRLRDRGWTPACPVGVNLGKSKATPLEDAAADYRLSAERLREVADWLTVNVSSPNTPGLRSLQDPEALARVVAAVRGAAPAAPLFVKLSPDLSDEALLDAARVAAAEGANGLVATNTTLSRPGLEADPSTIAAGEGGLSGPQLRPRALAAVHLLARESSLPVVGAGGVSTAGDVRAFLDAGARAVQLFTALVYEGPSLPSRLHAALLEVP